MQEVDDNRIFQRECRGLARLGHESVFAVANGAGDVGPGLAVPSYLLSDCEAAGAFPGREAGCFTDGQLVSRGNCFRKPGAGSEGKAPRKEEQTGRPRGGTTSRVGDTPRFSLTEGGP